ncbi:MAG: hypothetical protein JSU65_02070 [Candidatus Zixiibacteriota bacterium]|nr:MAG: hypothetical protein JSU65_02070 [candidate division Zixibacteria bacterium]
MNKNLIRLAVVSFIAVSIPFSPAADDTRLTFDHYYDGPAVLEALQYLNRTYSDYTELRSIGQSEEGRDIWLFTINNPVTGRDTDKPGIYVDGTIHGNEIQAAEVCLYVANYLLTSYDTIPAIKELVDNRSFYIIPIVNVDNRARFFEDAASYSIGRTARVPFDDDRDGLADEDPDEDIDGDGEILQMRIKDPFGDRKSHPDDPRVMIRTEPGELGEWRVLGREGIDNDNDGRLNEDGPGYLDMNRNYGFKWQPPYVQGGAGEFPMSARVNKAIADFVITKPNICFDFAFHNSGGLIVRGPGSKLAGHYPSSDVAVYDFLGEEGEKILPGYRYIIGGQDMYTTHGDFDEFMFSNLGIFGFVGELFMGSQERYPSDTGRGGDESYPRGRRETSKQKFSDNLTQGTMFRDWKEFDHPQYGKIEIGGWRPYSSRIGQPFLLPEMCHRNASLVLFTARHAPDITLELLEVKDIGNGLRRVRVRASNENAIPSLSQNAVRRKIYRKDMLTIAGSGIEVVSGGTVDDLVFDRVDYVDHRPERIFTSIPSFGKRDIQWIVRGRGRATVTYDAIKAGNQSLTIDL